MADLKLSTVELFELLESTIYKRPDKHPLFQDLDLHEQIFTRKPNLNELFYYEPSPIASKITFEHDPRNGKLGGFREEYLNLDGNDVEEMQNAYNSLSIDRIPSLDQSIKGNPTYFPFKPANVRSEPLRQNSQFKPPLHELIEFENLLLQPPNFESGLVSNALEEEDKEMFKFNEQMNEQLFEEINIYSVHKQERRREAIEHNLLSAQLESLGPVVKEMSIRDHVTPPIHDKKYVQLLDATSPVDDFEKRVPYPARQFPFELDTFQKKAIICLEEKKNVLVAAHTSAGKTVIAEYAISMSFQNLTRVVYTSPIKALSNQKFRDFRIAYGNDNVGLLTGDIQINNQAPCLIMTTEILLQILYNGSELIRDLEWVIFDEVHYVNDKERGHIWEEIFILLPDHISLVLLSATVSNISDFGGWLGKARDKTTYVIYTTKRPVPLEHFLYLGTDGRTDQYFKIIDKDNKFDNVEYRKAGNMIKEKEQRKTSGHLRNKKYSGAAGAKTKTLQPKIIGKNNYNATEKNLYISMIRNLQSNKKLPLIVFIFSRKKCNESASTFWQCMDLCKAREKSRIHNFLMRSLQKLKKSDRALPQVTEICMMLKNGFGVHHSGILPLLREITEILFQMGLVKVLFATETFAMGVNMPAKSVAFDTLEKHDGICKRELLASEYIQMAGRAGRRGKDETGTVIIICKDGIQDEATLLRITANKVCPIESKFRLTYQMILNVLRTRNHLRIESIMEKAFSEHKMQSQLDNWIREKDALEHTLKTFVTPDCLVCKQDLHEFALEFYEYQANREELMVLVCCNVLANKRILETGRMIIFEAGNPFQVGVILKVRFSPSLVKTELRVIGFDLLEMIEFLGRGEKVKSKIHTIELKQVDCILKLKVNGFISANVTDDHESKERQLMCKLAYEKLTEPENGVQVNSLKNLFQLPYYNPCTDLKMTELEFYCSYNKFEASRTNLFNKVCISCKNFIKHSQITLSKVTQEARLNKLLYLLSNKNLECLPEYERRLNVLKELGYLNEELVLTMKGKVACLISQQELVITDLLVDNFLHDLKPAEIVAVISCFVFQENVSGVRIENENLFNKFNQVITVAKKIDAVQYKFEVNQSPTEIQDSLRFGLVDVVYQWGLGLPFIDLIKLTKVQEGSIVRTIQRIDELLKELISAANLIGDIELVAKIQEASKCIRRDIVFSVSLYVQETALVKE